MENTIDQYDFLTLRGQPEAIKRLVRIVSRPGTRGISIWRQARKGVPFTVVSLRDVDSLAAGRLLYLQYVDLKGRDPVDMVWNDLGMSSERVQTAVIDVRIRELRKLTSSLGGLSNTAGALLVCEWDLVAVEIDQDEES